MGIKRKIKLTFLIDIYNLLSDRLKRKNNFQLAFCIFAISLIVRLTCVFLFEPKLNFDGVEYHNLAVNIIKNSSYSFAPIDSGATYYREPGYPLFLAATYYIWHSCNGELKTVSKDEHTFQQLNGKYPEMTFAKLAQAFLSSISCMLLFFILIRNFRRRFAFITALCYAVFYFSIYFDLQLLRESFQTTITIATSYFFVLFLFKRQILFFILFSAFSTLLVLILKTALVMPLFVFIFLVVKWKKITSPLVYAFLNGFFIFLLSLPWLIRTYSVYPDYRIVFSWGTTITQEKMAYINASRDTERLGLTHPLAKGDKELWPQGVVETYDKTFDGTYKNNTAILKQYIKKFDKHFYMKKPFKTFIRSIKLFVYKPPFPVIHKDGFRMRNLLSQSTGVVIGLLFMMGCFSAILKHHFLFIGSIMFMIVYLLMGAIFDRHFAPATPYYIFSAVYGLAVLKKWFYRKNNLLYSTAD